MSRCLLSLYPEEDQIKKMLYELKTIQSEKYFYPLDLFQTKFTISLFVLSNINFLIFFFLMNVRIRDSTEKVVTLESS